MVGPLSTGMSECATAPCSVNAGERRWTWVREAFGDCVGEEAQVVVAVGILRDAARTHDVDL